MKSCMFKGAILLSVMSMHFASAQSYNNSSNSVNRNPAQDRNEGWVVRQTETGLVKVPAKQYFRFEGANISGKAYTPFQAVFDQRPNRKNKSLIPVRTSFKREVLDASGYSGR